jgi:hypothetical protein
VGAPRWTKRPATNTASSIYGYTLSFKPAGTDIELTVKTLGQV